MTSPEIGVVIRSIPMKSDHNRHTSESRCSSETAARHLSVEKSLCCALDLSCMRTGDVPQCESVKRRHVPLAWLSPIFARRYRRHARDGTRDGRAGHDPHGRARAREPAVTSRTTATSGPGRSGDGRPVAGRAGGVRLATPRQAGHEESIARRSAAAALRQRRRRAAKSPAGTPAAGQSGRPPR